MVELVIRAWVRCVLAELRRGWGPSCQSSADKLVVPLLSLHRVFCTALVLLIASPFPRRLYINFTWPAEITPQALSSRLEALVGVQGCPSCPPDYPPFCQYPFCQYHAPQPIAQRLDGTAQGLYCFVPQEGRYLILTPIPHMSSPLSRSRNGK